MKKLLCSLFVVCLLMGISTTCFAKENESKVKEVSISTGDYLTEEEAKCFIGFLFNTNELTDDQLNRNGMYQLMTGKLSGEEEEQAGIQFLQFMNAQLSSTMEDLGTITNNSSEFLIQYLSTKTNGDLASDIATSTLHNIGEHFFDYIKDEYILQHPLEPGYDFFKDGMLDWNRINQIKDITGKVDEYQKQILALAHATFYVSGSNREEMFKYFLSYKNLLDVKYTNEDYVFQLLKDTDALYNDKLNIIKGIDSILSNWSFLDDKILLWATEDRLALIERWADYSYLLEKRIEKTAVSNENEEIEEDNPAVHYTVIDESDLEYQLTENGAVITGYKGGYAYARIPNNIKGYKVIEISPGAFSTQPWLRYVYIPSSVMKIGEKAFLNCTGLQKAIIPNGKVEIGKRAFGVYRSHNINGKDYVLDKGLGVTLYGPSGSNVERHAVESGNLFESTDWDGISATEVFPVGNTYYVNTVSELAWIGKMLNTNNSYEGKKVVISGDLNFNANSWAPIGGSARPFKGEIEISDCNLMNFRCPSDYGGWYYNEVRSGLFGEVASDYVKVVNTVFDNADVSGGGYQSVRVGILFGQASISTNGKMIIDNCFLSGVSKGREGENGGLIGRLEVGEDAQIMVKNVILDNLVIGGVVDYLESMVVGGLASNVINNGSICISDCNISGDFSALAGRNTTGQIHPGKVGGLLGKVVNNRGSSIDICRCNTDFSVKTEGGNNYIGTFISELYTNDGSIKVSDTSNRVDFQGGAFNGFLGHAQSESVKNVIINNSYLINVGKEVKLFWGEEPAIYASLYNCHYLEDKISCPHYSTSSKEREKAVKEFEKNARSAEEMKTVGNYVNWDFKNVWCAENNAYPTLLSFIKDKSCYSINADSLGGGELSPIGITNAVEGTSITYHIMPDEMYKVDALIVDGVPIMGGNTYTFENITSNHTIVATFKKRAEYKIEYELNSGSLDGEIQTAYYEGIGMKLPVPKREGFVFGGWYETEEFDGEKLLEITSDRVEDIKIYAKWIEIVKMPYADIESGTYTENLSVTLASDTPGTSIYYTLDGTDPRRSETRIEYIEPIEIKGILGKEKNIELLVCAKAEGMIDSDVEILNYTIKLPKEKVERFDIINVQEPQYGNIPDHSVECASKGVMEITGISWDPDTAKFGYNTAYTLTMTLVLKEGYEIAENITATVNGNSVEDVQVLDENSILISYTFEKTQKEPQEMPENVVSYPTSFADESDGIIAGVNSSMEYKAEGDETYQACPDGEVTGLPSGTYYIRYRENEEYGASQDLKIVVAAGEEKTFTLSVAEVEFGEEVYGYLTAEEKVIDIASTGNCDATIDRIRIDSEEFLIIDKNAEPIVKKGTHNATYMIRPNMDLGAGEHRAKIIVEYNNGETATASVSILVDKAPQDLPEGLTASSPLYMGESNGSILGCSDRMEYSTEKNGTYSPCVGEKIEGLQAGIYFVRYAEDENHYAGEPIKMVIEDGKVRPEGKVESHINVAAGAPQIKINSDIELIKQAILSENEKKLVSKGHDAKIFLSIKAKDSASDDAEEQQMRKILGDFSPGAYLDIELFKQIGGLTEQQVFVLSDKISITIDIPEGLINVDKDVHREYGIIRIHDGTAESLYSEYDSRNQTLTFKTDRFSTYIITYKDTVTNADNVELLKGDSRKDEPAKTGDGADVFGWIILMSLSAGVIASRKIR